MAVVLGDRVLETSTTQGTGTLNLAGATTGFQTFVAAVGNGAQVSYLIDDGTDWEVGIGTVTDGTPDTLSRDTILQSSNADAAVNWGSGTRNVRLTVPADIFPTLRSNNTFQETNSFTGKVKYPDDGELTIATGAITVTGVFHTVDTEGDAASDNLDTISGGADGQILVLRIENSARNVVLTTSGNIQVGALMETVSDIVVLQYDGTLSKWLLLSRPLLDEDSMTTDSANQAPTQQSVKAYVAKRIVQRVRGTTAAAATGTTQMVNDDTIPQNTEGFEVLTQAITPTNASNILYISGTVNFGSAAAESVILGLFQDTTANALAAWGREVSITNVNTAVNFEYYMVAGTTSSTTFKLRLGPVSAATTLTINGTGGARKLGGVLVTDLNIWEIQV